MKNAVFMGTEAGNVYHRVYKKEVRETLSSKLDFIDGLVTLENFKEKKSELSTVEYIFAAWGMPSVSEEDIAEYLPKVKAVFYGAGSVQGFARAFLNRGVKVFSAWAANAIPVAEYAVAQIILANKGFYQSCVKFKAEGRTAAGNYSGSFKGNFGANVGLLGAGMIGKEVIKLLKPYKLNIFVFDPFLPQQKADELGVTPASLDEIFANCDVISNHLANNEQTQKMLTYHHFSMFKDNATFINTGRGAQLIEEDLVRALKEKPNATAILDVTFPEPPVDGHDFYKMENVFLTPHIAGSAGDEVARMGEYMLEEFQALTSCKQTKYEVTVEMLATMA